MNACHPTFPMHKDRLRETLNRLLPFGEQCATQGFQYRSSSQGGIYSYEQAERLLCDDKADIIGFARQALADPDWFEKVRQGYGDKVMVCRYSNYCEGLDQKHKQVTCELWDRKELDGDNVVLASDGKRRLTAPAWTPSPD